MVIENEVGFAYGGRRKRRVDGQFYWRVTQFLMPMYTLIPGPGWPRACVGVVPIDDHHCLRFQVSYNPEAPIAARAAVHRARAWRVPFARR